MIQEPFAYGESWVYKLDPRLKIAGAVVLSVTAALVKDFRALGVVLAFSILLVLSAKLKPLAVGKRLLSILGFMLLIWLVLPLTYEGEPLYSIGPLTVTRPGVLLCAQITLKSVSILLLFMALISTMTIATLGHALDGLRVPVKLVQLLLMTYRYIFVIEQEYQRLTTAIKIRGFRSGTNLHSYRTFAYLIGMLFVRASVRAKQVQNAMACRGFRGRFYSLAEYKPFRGNWLFLAMMIWMTLVLIFLEIGRYGY